MDFESNDNAETHDSTRRQVAELNSSQTEPINDSHEESGQHQMYLNSHGGSHGILTLAGRLKREIDQDAGLTVPAASSDRNSVNSSIAGTPEIAKKTLNYSTKISFANVVTEMMPSHNNHITSQNDHSPIVDASAEMNSTGTTSSPISVSIPFSNKESLSRSSLTERVRTSIISRVASTRESQKKPCFDSNRFEKLIVYTKAVPYPKLINTIRENRFISRFVQAVCAVGAFIGIGVASLDFQYTSGIQGYSGINAMCLVSISSFMVSLTCMVVYAFPVMLGIPPHRHNHFSVVEVSIDVVYFFLWIGASSAVAVFGKCPSERIIFAQTSFRTSLIDDSRVNCGTWIFSYVSGFACAFVYVITISMAIYDLNKQGKQAGNESWGHVMFARGSWK